MSDNTIPAGYLPDMHGKPILASCVNCNHCYDDSDGPEYGPSFYSCSKKPHMGHLKGFPFKTSQKCCELHFVHFVDWDAEAKKWEPFVPDQNT